jgi:hypothetical protein
MDILPSFYACEYFVPEPSGVVWATPIGYEFELYGNIDPRMCSNNHSLWFPVSSYLSLESPACTAASLSGIGFFHESTRAPL